MTAIDSHVTVEIARDCTAHQPDLFIVYLGNNEVVGPTDRPPSSSNGRRIEDSSAPPPG